MAMVVISGGNEVHQIHGANLMPEGFVRACKPIERIRPGDIVLSRNENSPEAPLTPARVVQTFVNHANIVALTIGSQTIRTTAEHPFWVRGRGWTDVKDLVVGD